MVFHVGFGSVVVWKALGQSRRLGSFTLLVLNYAKCYITVTTL